MNVESYDYAVSWVAPCSGSTRRHADNSDVDPNKGLSLKISYWIDEMQIKFESVQLSLVTVMLSHEGVLSDYIY